MLPERLQGRALLVEDNPVNRIVTLKILQIYRDYRDLEPAPAVAQRARKTVRMQAGAASKR